MLSAAAIIIGIITFYIKLNKDSEVAAYRETIAYMDRHAEELKMNWEAIQAETADRSQIKSFLKRLEQMALLVNKKAFDNELVYSSYWELYCEPMDYKDVSDFFEKSRTTDKHIFSEYKKLSENWAARIKAEQDGESKATPQNQGMRLEDIGTICPACGNANDFQMASDKKCWCFDVPVDKFKLEQALKDKSKD